MAARIRAEAFAAALAAPREQRRRAGAERIERLRGLIEEERRRREEALAAAREGMLQETTQFPLQTQVGNFPLTQGKIIGYEDGRLDVGFALMGSGSAQYRWSVGNVPENVRGRFLRLLRRHLPPVELFQVARELLALRRYDAARELFEEAVKKEPRLARYVPDFAALEHGIVSFHTAVERTGSRVRLRYGFDAEAEAEDWQAEEGVQRSVAGGRLRIGEGGGRFARIWLGEMHTTGEVTVRIRPGPAAPQTLHVVLVQGRTDRIAGVGVAWDTHGNTWLALQRMEDGSWRQAGAPASVSGAELTLTLSSRGSSARCGGGTLPLPAWDMSGVTKIGLGAEGGGSGVMAEFEECAIEVRAHPRWIGKLMAEENHLLAQALVRSEAPPGWSVGESVGMPQEPDPFATDYDAAQEWIPEAVRSARDRGREMLKALMEGRARDPFAALEETMRQFDQMVSLAPDLALGYYYRGVLRSVLGDYTGARGDLEAATERDEEFLEAWRLRGRLENALGRWAEAGECFQRAQALAPDHADIAIGFAWCAFFAGDEGRAREALDWIAGLNPSEEIARQAFQLRTVLRGPAWLDVRTKETPHYEIRTDMDERTAERYAAILEAVRPEYERLVGPPQRDTGRAKVYVFNTAESYYTYALVTLNDRMEHTLGLSHPLYKQLLVIDVPEESETIETLIHEGFHQYLDRVAPGAPGWFNEGMAEYVGGTWVEDGRVVQRGMPLSGRLATLRDWLGRGGALPTFRQLAELGYEWFQSPYGPILYAQAWSWVHFLAEGAGGRYAERLRRYVDALREGKNLRESFDAAFGDLDQRQLEQEWLAHVRALLDGTRR